MMGAREAILGMALAFAFAAAFAASIVAFAQLEANALAARLRRESGAGAAWRRILAGGVPALAGVSGRLLGMKACAAYFDRLCLALRMKGVESGPGALCSLFAAAAIAFLAVGVVAASPVAACAFAACVVVAASSWAAHVIETREAAMREALPDALRAMGVCFHAGFTLRQTFRQLQHECTGPLGELFSCAASRMELGATAEEALEGLRSAGGIAELAFVAVALEVQHHAGGSMQQVLDAACESLESELALKRTLRVQTAQARLSARVVVGVTIALVGVLALATEDFLAPFFASALGLGVLALALGMQVVGLVAVRRLLNVEGA